MFWELTTKTEKRLAQLQRIIKASFSNVKNDTSSIFQWLDYLYKKGLEQDTKIANYQAQISAYQSAFQQQASQIQAMNSYIHEIRKELADMPKTPGQLKAMLDESYPLSDILSRVADVELRLKEIAARPAAAPEVPELDDVFKRLEKLERAKVSLKEKLIKRVTKNSKDYVKSIILSYIHKYGKVSAQQLREMMVDEQGLCSKSSFYRILEEIESSDDISTIRQGKEKHYFSKLSRKI